MKQLTLKERAFQALSLENYRYASGPEILNKIDIKCPYERQYILRMLVKKDDTDYLVPSELQWIMPMFDEAFHYQYNILKVRHSFCYITVRSGLVESKNDDVWHVDGFSTRITHLPEQNYGWCDVYPTQYYSNRIFFPPNFDPLKHNINLYIPWMIENSCIHVVPDSTLFCFDPYVIHRRPPYIPKNTKRTFVRISFTPIEINDVNNTINPLLSTNYTKDGIKDFRDKLKNYYD